MDGGGEDGGSQAGLTRILFGEADRSVFASLLHQLPAPLVIGRYDSGFRRGLGGYIHITTRIIKSNKPVSE
ncbi:MAG: hypothetical protein JWQ00_1201 [Noviherbaspirillum sp.]|nr:hypothetical protein [Noviherbaspirillum sp.]